MAYFATLYEKKNVSSSYFIKRHGVLLEWVSVLGDSGCCSVCCCYFNTLTLGMHCFWLSLHPKYSPPLLTASKLQPLPLAVWVSRAQLADSPTIQGSSPDLSPFLLFLVQTEASGRETNRKRIWNGGGGENVFSGVSAEFPVGQRHPTLLPSLWDKGKSDKAQVKLTLWSRQYF